jgi:hypothetical protein
VPEETIAGNYTLNWDIDSIMYYPEPGYKIKIQDNSGNLLAESNEFEITSSPNIYVAPKYNAKNCKRLNKKRF